MDDQTHHLRSKRALDILLSLCILIILSPLWALAIVLIKCEQVLRGRWRDPLFYAERRMSEGRPFTLRKFNIFKYERVLEARARGVFIHTKEYERHGGITKIGWLLKQIYMDEVPQFLSVLRGDMSIVGPRPVNMEVYAALMSRGVTDKNRVPAGITGLLQSQKGLDHSGADALDKEYADYYHNNPWYRVLLFDLTIMLRTCIVILRAKGI